MCCASRSSEWYSLQCKLEFSEKVMGLEILRVEDALIFLTRIKTGFIELKDVKMIHNIGRYQPTHLSHKLWHSRLKTLRRAEPHSLP